ncbi:hypothetical protein [Dyadobacter sp. CY326]|uniref:hypothetical protein n=1 Tax=Dyadobacter sp. CY326 TaxID=2907300 RepID=UPI001F3899F6|nr:hypothetical protein [Dyadobacter sp. CY326]MCE7068161.1 hypothetical protein [Dyadobacter sp. CY326]
MINRTNLYLSLLILLFSCDFQDHPPQDGNNGPVVDQNAFVNSLTAGNRYWRVEQLHIQVGDTTRRINFFPFTDAVEYNIATSVVPNTSFHFEKSIIDEVLGSGPYGNMPYPTPSNMEVTFLGLTSDGSWQWNNDRHTVELKLPGSMSAIIRSASRSKFYPVQGYLDNKVPPHFVSLSQAQNATEPERISVLVEENDIVLGKVYYTLILRSSWIIKRSGGTDKVPVYQVHY